MDSFRFVSVVSQNDGHQQQCAPCAEPKPQEDRQFHLQIWPLLLEDGRLSSLQCANKNHKLAAGERTLQRFRFTERDAPVQSV